MKPWKLLDSEFLVDAPWLKVAKETCELPNGKVIDDFYTLWQPDWVMILARTIEGKWVMTEQYRHGTGKIALEFPAGIIDKGETPEQAAIRELQEECGYCLDERRETKDERRFPVGAGNDKSGGSQPNKVTDPAEGDRIHKETCVDPIEATTSCFKMTEIAPAPNTYNLKPITYLGNFPVNPDRHRGRFHVVFIDGVERLGNTSFDDTEDIESWTLSDKELQEKMANGTFDHPLQMAGYFKWKLAQKSNTL